MAVIGGGADQSGPCRNDGCHVVHPRLATEDVAQCSEGETQQLGVINATENIARCVLRWLLFERIGETATKEDTQTELEVKLE